MGMDTVIRGCVNDLLAGDMTATLPLLDRLEESGDPRRTELEDLIGRLYVYVARGKDPWADGRLWTGSWTTSTINTWSTPPGPKELARQRKEAKRSQDRHHWSVFANKICRMFWREIAGTSMRDAVLKIQEGMKTREKGDREGGE